MSSKSYEDTIRKQLEYNKIHFQIQMDDNMPKPSYDIMCMNNEHRQHMSIALGDKIVNSNEMADEMEVKMKNLVEREGTSAVSDAIGQQVDHIRNEMIPEYKETLDKLGETQVCKT